MVTSLNTDTAYANLNTLIADINNSYAEVSIGANVTVNVDAIGADIAAMVKDSADSYIRDSIS